MIVEHMTLLTTLGMKFRTSWQWKGYKALVVSVVGYRSHDIVAGQLVLVYSVAGELLELMLFVGSVSFTNLCHF